MSSPLPDLDSIVSDAHALKNAAFVARIVVDHCLAMKDITDANKADYKKIMLLDRQIEALHFSMLSLQDMTERLADRLDNYQLETAP